MLGLRVWDSGVQESFFFLGRIWGSGFGVSGFGVRGSGFGGLGFQD